MQTSQLLGIKLLLISFAFFILLIIDAISISQLLNSTKQISVLQVQIWGSCLVTGGVVAGISLLNLKKVSTARVSFYLIMALVFIALPFSLATSPYSITAFF